MKVAKVDYKLCKGCGLCAHFCPQKAIRMSEEVDERGFQLPIIDEKKCVGCGICSYYCPDFAIYVEEENPTP